MSLIVKYQNVIILSIHIIIHIKINLNFDCSLIALIDNYYEFDWLIAKYKVLSCQFSITKFVTIFSSKKIYTCFSLIFTCYQLFISFPKKKERVKISKNKCWKICEHICYALTIFPLPTKQQNLNTIFFKPESSEQKKINIILSFMWLFLTNGFIARNFPFQVSLIAQYVIVNFLLPKLIYRLSRWTELEFEFFLTNFMMTKNSITNIEIWFIGDYCTFCYHSTNLWRICLFNDNNTN